MKPQWVSGDAGKSHPGLILKATSSLCRLELRVLAMHQLPPNWAADSFARYQDLNLSLHYSMK